MTRWQGTTMAIGLAPLARPTAREAPGEPICRAIAPYVVVSPACSSRSALQTFNSNAPPRRPSGSAEASAAVPAK